MDVLMMAYIAPKGRKSVFCTFVVRLIWNGYIPQIEDHHYHYGVVFVNWRKGNIYCSTHHWNELGLNGHEARYTYCSLRVEDLSNCPLSWEATTKLI